MGCLVASLSDVGDKLSHCLGIERVHLRNLSGAWAFYQNDRKLPVVVMSLYDADKRLERCGAARVT